MYSYSQFSLSLSLSSENEKNSTALMLAALEGDEIIVDILIACVRDTMATACYSWFLKYCLFTQLESLSSLNIKSLMNHQLELISAKRGH